MPSKKALRSAASGADNAYIPVPVTHALQIAPALAYKEGGGGGGEVRRTSREAVQGVKGGIWSPAVIRKCIRERGDGTSGNRLGVNQERHASAMAAGCNRI